MQHFVAVSRAWPDGGGGGVSKVLVHPLQPERDFFIEELRFVAVFSVQWRVEGPPLSLSLSLYLSQFLSFAPC